jgi:phenylacetic acid degradation protein
MVGMNAVVMDDANIGESSIVAAVAFVPAGFECPPRSLVIGVPAKIKRQLSDQEAEWKARGTVEYQQLAQRCRATLKKVEALTEAEPDRRRINLREYSFKP